jgi:hypothetical protein
LGRNQKIPCFFPDHQGISPIESGSHQTASSTIQSVSFRTSRRIARNPLIRRNWQNLSGLDSAGSTDVRSHFAFIDRTEALSGPGCNFKGNTPSRRVPAAVAWALALELAVRLLVVLAEAVCLRFAQRVRAISRNRGGSYSRASLGQSNLVVVNPVTSCARPSEL